METVDEPINDQSTTQDLTKKVRQLINTSSNRHHMGAEIVALGDEGLAILCSLAASERQLRTRLRWFFLGLMLAGPLIDIALIVILPRPRPAIYQVLTGGIRFLGIAGIVIASVRGMRTNRLLCCLDDVRLVGPLLDSVMLLSLDTQTNESLRRSLSRLLPQLRASDKPHLLPHHITALNRELARCHSWKWESSEGLDYALAILKALEQVGDETSLPAVEKVLATSKNEKVREAAEACLPFLQQRAVMGKHTLLRASNHNTADLLLPASGSIVHEPDTLLRAATEPASKT